MNEKPTEEPIKKTALLLQVEGVTLRYRTRDHLVTATWRVTFNVLQSDRIVILGPSGCGKSTLLKAVGGYSAPVEGSIFLNGAKVVLTHLARLRFRLPGVRSTSSLEDRYGMSRTDRIRADIQR